MQEAYDILSDPKKRQMYDQYGFYSENGSLARARRRAAGPQPQPNMDFDGFDFSDYFSAARRSERRGGGAASGAEPAADSAIFSPNSSRRRRREQPSRPEKGDDLEYSLASISGRPFAGTQATLNITRYDICPTCHGSGRPAAGPVTCPECNGSG